MMKRTSGSPGMRKRDAEGESESSTTDHSLLCHRDWLS